MAYNKLYKRGTANVNSRLTDATAATIRELNKRKGWTVTKLALTFNISRTAIQKVLTRQTWADVDDEREIARLLPLAQLLTVDREQPEHASVKAIEGATTTLQSRESTTVHHQSHRSVHKGTPDVGTVGEYLAELGVLDISELTNELFHTFDNQPAKQWKLKQAFEEYKKGREN